MSAAECTLERVKTRVAVVTLPGRFNYGNRLQCYAAYRAYERRGLAPECLVFRRPEPMTTAKDVVKRMLGRETSHPEDNMTTSRLAAFDRFNSRMRIREFRRIPRGLADEYECFSAGSDQIWNPRFIEGYEGWYFLKVARPEQRLALAPSIGLSCLDEVQARVVREGIEGFAALSVREGRGAELIRELTGREARVICDPTMALLTEEWRSVSDGRLTPDEPYVFTYLLGGVGKDASVLLAEVTEDGEIPVVSLTDREKPEEPPAGPAEFVDLVAHAQHVVTDSFHASVFACLFGVPLTIVRREGPVEMFSRIETLTKALGIESRVYGNPGYSHSYVGDYDRVFERIAVERAAFDAYLDEALGATL